MGTVRTINLDDMAYSGPGVWPKIVAWEAYDRFIHRRPELVYLLARRKLEEGHWTTFGLPHTGLIRIRIGIVNKNLKRKRKQALGSFLHTIVDDREEDVRAFLNALRDNLCRHLPASSLPNIGVSLRFMHKNREITSVLEEWL